MMSSPRTPCLTSVPKLTNAHVAKRANSHNHTPEYIGKPNQKSGSYYNRKGALILEWDVQAYMS